MSLTCLSISELNKEEKAELNKMFLNEYCNSCYWHVMENWALTPAVACDMEERCVGAGLG